MGPKTAGVYVGEDGTWQVDKWWRGTRFRQRGFSTFAEAESWLIKKLEDKRTVVIHGQRPDRTFEQAATHYLLANQDKPSIVTDTYLLQSLMPQVGTQQLHQIHDGTLAAYVSARLKAGRKHKTINLGLGLVRHILNLAARSWRDESGLT